MRATGEQLTCQAEEWPWAPALTQPHDIAEDGERHDAPAARQLPFTSVLVRRPNCLMFSGKAAKLALTAVRQVPAPHNSVEGGGLRSECPRRWGRRQVCLTCARSGGGLCENWDRGWGVGGGGGCGRIESWANEEKEISGLTERSA